MAPNLDSRKAFANVALVETQTPLVSESFATKWDARLPGLECVQMFVGSATHLQHCYSQQPAFREVPATFAEQLVQELHGHVKEGASSPHANYVLQKAFAR